MVVAEAQLTRADSVPRRKHFRALGRGALVRALEAAERQVDPLAGGVALDRCKACGDNQLVGDTKQGIEQPGAARVGIFLDAENACEAAVTRPPHFDRIQPEADPRVRQMEAEVLLWTRQ